MQDVHRQRILLVAEVIERQPHTPADSPGSGFDMSKWVHGESACGTPSCIWGWAEHLRTGSPEVDRDAPMDPIFEWFGLDSDSSEMLALFTPMFKNTTMYRVTPAQAAETLRRLADTGRVDWSHVDPDWRL